MHILNKNIFKYNDLYNKIISLTREKFFYTEISLKDELITRGSKDKMKFLMNLFDNNNEMNFDKQKLLIYLDNYRYNLKDISLNFLIKGIITNKNY